jgi:hypothetical protein
LLASAEDVLRWAEVRKSDRINKAVQKLQQQEKKRRHRIPTSIFSSSLPILAAYQNSFFSRCGAFTSAT